MAFFKQSKYKHMWIFPAEVEYVKDGDTITAWIDQGFDEWRHEKYLRFNRIDAYETSLRRGTTAANKKKGLAGKAFLKELVEGKNVFLRIFKTKKSSRKGKYGRYIVEVYIKDEELGRLYHDHLFSVRKKRKRMISDHMIGDLININDIMVAKGFAVYKDY